MNWKFWQKKTTVEAPPPPKYIEETQATTMNAITLLVTDTNGKEHKVRLEPWAVDDFVYSDSCLSLGYFQMCDTEHNLVQFLQSSAVPTKTGFVKGSHIVSWVIISKEPITLTRRVLKRS